MHCLKIVLDHKQYTDIPMCPVTENKVIKVKSLTFQSCPDKYRIIFNFFFNFITITKKKIIYLQQNKNYVNNH